MARTTHTHLVNLSCSNFNCGETIPRDNKTGSVRNRPGARRGPAGGLPRAPDGTGRLAVVRPILPKGRTARVIYHDATMIHSEINDINSNAGEK